MKFDNIAEIYDDAEAPARAALKLLASIEAGTAFAEVPERGEAVKVGNSVKYKSISGIVYDAVLVGIGLNDVDIDVIVPGADPVRLTRIKYRVESK